MSLEPKSKHRKSKPATKSRRVATQTQRGKGGWPDYDDRASVFYTPTQTGYDEVLTIRSPKAAEEAVKWMKVEYKHASGKGKGFQQKGPDPEWQDYIRKGMDSTAKRAELSLKRTDPSLSPGERKEMAEVADIYKIALASSDFDNYYGEKRTQTRQLQSGTGPGKYPVKGVKKGSIRAGDSILRFRLRSTTVTEGKEVRAALVWKPFRMVYRSPDTRKVNAKVKEIRAAGFPVRVLRAGKTRFVYAHQGGRGKWRYQPADVWFFKQLAMRGTALKEARADFSKAKKASFKSNASAKARIKAAEKKGVIERGDYNIHKTEKGRHKIVTKREYERLRKAKQRKAKKK